MGEDAEQSRGASSSNEKFCCCSAAAIRKVSQPGTRYVRSHGGRSAMQVGCAASCLPPIVRRLAGIPRQQVDDADVESCRDCVERRETRVRVVAHAALEQLDVVPGDPGLVRQFLLRHTYGGA